MRTPDRCSLLIVDAEPSILAVLSTLLRKDFLVLTATSGQDAERILAERGADLILADERLPDMPGVQLLESVRRRFPGTLRLLMAAFLEIEDAIDAINCAQVHRFFLKPWRSDELLEAMREAAAAFRRQRDNDRLLEELHQLKLHSEPADRPLFIPARG